MKKYTWEIGHDAETFLMNLRAVSGEYRLVPKGQVFDDYILQLKSDSRFVLSCAYRARSSPGVRLHGQTQEIQGKTTITASLRLCASVYAYTALVLLGMAYVLFAPPSFANFEAPYHLAAFIVLFVTFVSVVLGLLFAGRKLIKLMNKIAFILQ